MGGRGPKLHSPRPPRDPPPATRRPVRMCGIRGQYSPLCEPSARYVDVHRRSADASAALQFEPMPFAAINGIDLYYEVDGTGPAILFAHGQGGNHLSWWQQVPFFSRHFTCITFDHRAFGQSVDHEGKGRRGFSDDAVGLLDHLGIEDVRIVAHSMGGRIATMLATRDPKARVRALVLAGTTGAVADEAVRQGRDDAEAARGGKGLGAFSVYPPYKRANPAGYFLLREISRLNPSRPKDFLGPPNPPPPPPGSPPRIPMYQRLLDSGTPV